MGPNRSNHLVRILSIIAFIFAVSLVGAAIYTLIKKVDSHTSQINAIVDQMASTTTVPTSDTTPIPDLSIEEKFSSWGYTLRDAITVRDMLVGAPYCVVDADLGPTINMTMAAPVMWAIDSPYYDPTLSAPEDEIIPIVPIGGLTYLPVDLIGAGDNPSLDYVRTFDGPCVAGRIGTS